MDTEHRLSMASSLTALTRLLLEQGKTQSHTHACAKGRFYRASVSIELVPVEQLQAALYDDR